MSKPSAGSSRPERGGWSSRRKAEIVLRLLRGEELGALNRELGVTAATIAGWRDHFLASRQARLRCLFKGHDGMLQDRHAFRRLRLTHCRSARPRNSCWKPRPVCAQARDSACNY